MNNQLAQPIIVAVPSNYESIIEARSKDLPSSRYSYKVAGKGTLSHFGMDVAFAQDIECNESEMSIWIPIADGNRRDGVGDLLEISGIKTERHKANPVVLFDHGKRIELPIAMAAKWDDASGRYDFSQYTFVPDPTTQVAKVQAYFYRGKGRDLDNVDRKTEYDHALFCEQLFDMACKRLVQAGSIGYQVIAARELPPDYERGTPKGLHLLSILMLEGSLVVMPANQDTVMKMLSMPLCCGKPLSPMLVKSLQPYAAEPKVSILLDEMQPSQKPSPVNEIETVPDLVDVSQPSHIPPPRWKPGLGALKDIRNAIKCGKGDYAGYGAKRSKSAMEFSVKSVEDFMRAFNSPRSQLTRDKVKQAITLLPLMSKTEINQVLEQIDMGHLVGKLSKIKAIDYISKFFTVLMNDQERSQQSLKSTKSATGDFDLGYQDGKHAAEDEVRDARAELAASGGNGALALRQMDLPGHRDPYDQGFMRGWKEVVSKAGKSISSNVKMTDAERNKARKVQDKLLKLAAVQKFVDDHGENKPLWEGGPSASQLQSMIYPKWIHKCEELISEYGSKSLPSKTKFRPNHEGPEKDMMEYVEMEYPESASKLIQEIERNGYRNYQYGSEMLNTRKIDHLAQSMGITKSLLSRRKSMGEICPRCHGMRIINPGPMAVICPACGGLGKPQVKSLQSFSKSMNWYSSSGRGDNGDKIIFESDADWYVTRDDASPDQYRRYVLWDGNGQKHGNYETSYEAMKAADKVTKSVKSLRTKKIGSKLPGRQKDQNSPNQDSQQICPQCNGDGHIGNTSTGYRICPICRGTGKKPQRVLRSAMTLRKEYRPAQRLRKRLRKSIPGSSLVFINRKDMHEAEEYAEGKGVKFNHVGSHRKGIEKVKLVGQDESIDDVAKAFGRPIKGMMGKKSMPIETKSKVGRFLRGAEQGAVTIPSGWGIDDYVSKLVRSSGLTMSRVNGDQIMLEGPSHAVDSMIGTLEKARNNHTPGDTSTAIGRAIAEGQSKKNPNASTNHTDGNCKPGQNPKRDHCTADKSLRSRTKAYPKVGDYVESVVGIDETEQKLTGKIVREGPNEDWVVRWSNGHEDDDIFDNDLDPIGPGRWESKSLQARTKDFNTWLDIANSVAMGIAAYNITGLGMDVLRSLFNRGVDPKTAAKEAVKQSQTSPKHPKTPPKPKHDAYLVDGGTPDAYWEDEGGTYRNPNSARASKPGASGGNCKPGQNPKRDRCTAAKSIRSKGRE